MMEPSEGNHRRDRTEEEYDKPWDTGDTEEFDNCPGFTVTVLGSTMFAWPKSHYTPVQRASDIEQQLPLVGF